MSGRRFSGPARLILFVAGVLIFAVVALGILWWNGIKKLSPGSLAVFAAEIQTAAQDSMITPADVSLLEELQAIAASKESTLAGRSLCIVVGTSPLLRGSMSDTDRRDIVLVRDYLLPKKGHLSGTEFAAFLRSNPQIDNTFHTYRATMETAVSRRRQS